ncbi:unnamed protein product [Leptosia nina]|uniref:Uncharacterized protein n=1 Tax=Leptosia nina TaxID=320188 RepID=A0AAV1IXM4_9NEOP
MSVHQLTGNGASKTRNSGRSAAMTWRVLTARHNKKLIHHFVIVAFITHTCVLCAVVSPTERGVAVEVQNSSVATELSVFVVAATDLNEESIEIIAVTPGVMKDD